MTAYPKISEAEIRRRIASDADSPEITDEQMKTARSFREAFPGLAASIDSTRRGRPKLDSPKEVVSLRVDPQTIAKFKAAGGAKWRARMSLALDKAQVSTNVSAEVSRKSGKRG